MKATAQRVCVCSGFALVVLFFVGFGAVARFLVPPSPNESAHDIARMFAGNRDGIRIGLLISMFAAALLVPWSAGLFIQLRRAEGPSSPLPYVQMICGSLFSLEFIYLIMFWQVAAFRPDASPEIIRTLDDMAWIPFVGLTSTAVVQAVALGFSMLSDDRVEPVFPRWAGYLNIWAGLMFTPGSLCIFFKDGPLAYNGVVAWYLPVAVFALWMPLNSVLALRAIDRQQQEELVAASSWTAPGVPAPGIEALADELAAMRQDLARALAAAEA